MGTVESPQDSLVSESSTVLEDSFRLTDRALLEALAFIPLPGFPSLYQRDMRNFGLAWVAVVPSSVLAAFWLNGASFRPGQAVFLTGAVYYAVTVATNRYLLESAEEVSE